MNKLIIPALFAGYYFFKYANTGLNIQNKLKWKIPSAKNLRISKWVGYADLVIEFNNPTDTKFEVKDVFINLEKNGQIITTVRRLEGFQLARLDNTRVEIPVSIPLEELLRIAPEVITTLKVENVLAKGSFKANGFQYEVDEVININA